MNTVKVFGGLLFLIIASTMIIRSSSIGLLIFICSTLLIGASFFESKNIIKQRIRTYIIIGISILIIQIFLNTGIPFTERLSSAFQAFLHLTILSQIVFLGMKYISPSEIVSGFFFLPPSITLLLSMTFYFVPLLSQEYLNIQSLQKVRGSGTTIRSRIFIPFSSLIPLFHRLFQRSETLSFSMLSRGYLE